MKECVCLLTWVRHQPSELGVLCLGEMESGAAKAVGEQCRGFVIRRGMRGGCVGGWHGRRRNKSWWLINKAGRLAGRPELRRRGLVGLSSQAAPVDQDVSEGALAQVHAAPSTA